MATLLERKPTNNRSRYRTHDKSDDMTLNGKHQQIIGIIIWVKIDKLALNLIHIH